VAHAGDELRLVLARELKLAVLVLNLVEQPRVLDRDSANVVTSSICLSVKGRTSERANASTPIGMPSRNIGTPSMVR
jgi:hypothetical protein